VSRKPLSVKVWDSLVAGLWLPLAWVHFQRFVVSGAWLSLGLAVETGLLALLFLVRAEERARGPRWEWFLAAFATLFPLIAFESVGQRHLPAEMLEAVALVGIVTALFSLGRSFGAAPANRGIRTGGLYRFVRHPLYSTEFLFLIGYVWGNFTSRNLAVLLVVGVAQYWRAWREEQLLSQAPEYCVYQSQVRWRFVPGVI
jgi:protein-S-isoprenylcysteine O-methyltransferase Ste14